MRRIVALAFVLSLVVGVFATAASATQPRRRSYTATFDAVRRDLCSFPVRVHEDAVITDTRYFDESGDVVRRVFPATFNGTASHAGNVVLERETVNQTVTSDLAVITVGLNWHFKLPSGRTVVIDAGRLVYDADGNLTFEAGRHQFVDREVRAFCAALG
jgi:hypothetical protein